MKQLKKTETKRRFDDRCRQGMEEERIDVKMKWRWTDRQTDSWPLNDVQRVANKYILMKGYDR